MQVTFERNLHVVNVV